MQSLQMLHERRPGQVARTVQLYLAPVQHQYLELAETGSRCQVFCAAVSQHVSAEIEDIQLQVGVSFGELLYSQVSEFIAAKSQFLQADHVWRTKQRTQTSASHVVS